MHWRHNQRLPFEDFLNVDLIWNEVACLCTLCSACILLLNFGQTTGLMFGVGWAVMRRVISLKDLKCALLRSLTWWSVFKRLNIGSVSVTRGARHRLRRQGLHFILKLLLLALNIVVDLAVLVRMVDPARLSHLLLYHLCLTAEMALVFTVSHPVDHRKERCRETIWTVHRDARYLRVVFGEHGCWIMDWIEFFNGGTHVQRSQ